MAKTPPPDGTPLPNHLSLVGEVALPAGQFRFRFADEFWEWSAEAATIHGYPAAEMNPTTDLVMSHKHPDDYAKMAATLEHVRRTHRSISTRHRIVDVQGNTRDVVVVSQKFYDDAGDVVGVQGFYIDVTQSDRHAEELERNHNRKLDDAVAEITERRSVIDEVKGMLMLIYRIGDEKAFELLRWRSQITNTKLRLLAQQLLDDFTSVVYDEVLPTRSTFDGLLLTAHERCADGLAS